jgi:hypothetical protein
MIFLKQVPDYQYLYNNYISMTKYDINAKLENSFLGKDSPSQNNNYIKTTNSNMQISDVKSDID